MPACGIGLLVVLAYSRHRFLRPICGQNLQDVVVGPEAAKVRLTWP